MRSIGLLLILNLFFANFLFQNWYILVVEYMEIPNLITLDLLVKSIPFILLLSYFSCRDVKSTFLRSSPLQRPDYPDVRH